MDGLLVALCAGVATYIAFPFPNASGNVSALFHRLVTAIKQHATTESDPDLLALENDLSLMSACLYSGRQIRVALRDVDFEVMQSLSRAAADGSSLGIAVGKIGSRLHFNELDAFALALDESERTGAPVVPLVELLARQVAHRNARGRLIRSELASTRATVSVLAMLPVLGVAMSAMFGGDSFRWLLHAGIGRICLVVGLALEMLGLLWIRVIVRRVI